MSSFALWFVTGFEHILYPLGYDHILFVTLLTLYTQPGELKKLLVMVTAFTAGHCITLALSVLAHLSISTVLIEFLIALSILIAGVFNLFTRTASQVRPALIYSTTLIFGLLHGLGFSFLLRSMLGRESDIVLPLLYFNLGIEAGQLIIVVAVTLISLFLTTKIHLPFRYFKFTIVCLISLIALKITSERLLQLLS